MWKKEPILSAKELLNKIFSREIVWIDKSKMSEADLLIWSNEAKMLLENRVFQSLVGKEGSNGEIVKNIIEHIAKNSKDWEEVKDLRSKIVGIELIREYAEDLLIRKNEETYDHLNDAV